MDGGHGDDAVNRSIVVGNYPKPNWFVKFGMFGMQKCSDSHASTGK